MRDEREGRKKQARSNKQQAHPRQSLFHMYMCGCIYIILYMCEMVCTLSVLRGLLLQTWFDKTPLGKKRKKAAQGDEGDAGAKGKGKGKGKKGKKGKKG